MQGEIRDRDVKLGERLERVKIKHAERFIRRADRNARAWRWTRWIIIAMGIAMLLSSGYLFHQSCRVFSDSLQGGATDPGSDPRPKVTALDVKLEMHFLTMALTSWFAGIVGLAIGAWMICYGAFGDRRVQSDLLLAALLKERLAAPDP